MPRIVGLQVMHQPKLREKLAQRDSATTPFPIAVRAIKERVVVCKVGRLVITTEALECPKTAPLQFRRTLSKRPYGNLNPGELLQDLLYGFTPPDRIALDRI